MFAVMTAGLFPIIHIGRQWIFYWLLPYPNQRFLWPNFKSPLLWDVFAISTYLTVSTTFLVFGLIPDVAAVRDKVTGLAEGRCTRSPRWAGRAPTTSGGTTTGPTSIWPRWRRRWCSRCTRSCRGTSRHRIVPGWHGTIFAPYFVAGAIYSGLGMVLTLIIPLRRALKIEHMITEYHFDNLAKLTLLTGSILFYAYAMEYFIAWYSGNTFEQTTFFRRAFGPQWWAGWTMIICNAVRLPASLVPEDPDQPHRALRHLDLHQHRDVVRALRDHRLVAEQRLHPVGVGHPQSHLGRLGNPGRIVRLVRHVVPPLRQELPDRGDPGDQGDDPDAAEAGRASLMARAAEVPARAGGARFVHRRWMPRPTRSARSRRGDIADLVVYSASPNHEVEEALEHKVSPVRLFTLIGGLTGCAAGFGMTIWMSLDWPTLVGGKTIASIPPYVVIAFELTILLGALSTVAAVGALLGAHGQARDRVRSQVQRRHDRHLRARRRPEQVGPTEELLRTAGARGGSS